MPRQRRRQTQCRRAWKTSRQRRHERSEVSQLLTRQCYNCMRCSRGGDPARCDLKLRHVNIDQAARRRKFILVTTSQFNAHVNADGVAKLTFCQECAEYLNAPVTKALNTNWQYVWPAFVWSLLSSTTVYKKKGDIVWSVIPRNWRAWWMNSLKKCHDGCAVTIDHPKAVFADVTMKRNKALSIIDNKRLFEIEREWCNVLECKIRCPWGCTEFVHKTHGLPYDVIVARSFELVSKDAIFVTEKIDLYMDKHVRGIRDDYLSFPLKHAECTMMNPEWEILPAVAFSSEGCLDVMVCRDCKGGCSKAFIYPPRNPVGCFGHCYGEQIAPAAVRSRIVKHGKASAYCNTYQMLNLQGHYNGVDSVRVTAKHGFLKRSTNGHTVSKSIFERTKGYESFYS